MTLKNLLGISLDAVAADKLSVGMLIAAAERNIADAQLQGLSSENRFDAAYKAIMQMAMVALNANGYRTLKSKPGHHQTAIQTLPLTVALPQPKVIVLDTLKGSSMKKVAAEPYRDIDFSKAKRDAVVPLEPGKTKISIRLDAAVIEYFRRQVEQAGGGNYQTLINDALVAFIGQTAVLDAVRQVVREELRAPRASPRQSKAKAVAA